MGVVRGARVLSGVTFESIGDGRCRDADGKNPSFHFKPSGTSKDECRALCAANAGCTALAHRVTDGRCINYGDALTDGNKPKGDGWLYNKGTGGSDAITKVDSRHTGWICERKIAAPGTCRCLLPPTKPPPWHRV